jgi:hypothetical protein
VTPERVYQQMTRQIVFCRHPAEEHAINYCMHGNGNCPVTFRDFPISNFNEISGEAYGIQVKSIYDHTKVRFVVDEYG